MSLRISNNIDAFGAHRRLTDATERMSRSMEKLASGYRINRGGDDAAGLSVSERMRGQIRGLATAQRNIQDGVSLVQTAEGNLHEVHSMLQRVRELAVQYKTGTLSQPDRDAIQSEVNQLGSEIARLGAQAEFNGIKLLDNTNLVTFQVGANDSDRIGVCMINVATAIPATTFSLTAAGASDINEIDLAINAVSAQRSSMGAIQNRLGHALNAAGTYQENLIAAESRIRDVDMAKEMVEYTKFSILAQAGQSMLSQANQAPQSVLQLLR